MPDPYILNGDESAIAVIWAQALAPGTVRWRGCRHGILYDRAGTASIGGFYRYSSGAGWSIWTTPYAGFAFDNELERMATCPCLPGIAAGYELWPETVPTPADRADSHEEAA